MDRAAYDVVKTVQHLDVELAVLKKENTRVSVLGVEDDESVEVVGELGAELSGFKQIISLLFSFIDIIFNFSENQTSRGLTSSSVSYSPKSAHIGRC